MTPEFKWRLVKNSAVNDGLMTDVLQEHQKHYKFYNIKQKGKIRQIEEPMPFLLMLQRGILVELQQIPVHPCCVARPGMSIRDNANLHAGAKHLLKLDIQGCYQAITYAYTGMVGLTKKWLTPDLEEVLGACFVKTKLGDHLPTGAPTSPALCNLALALVDEDISAMALRYGYQYTRYLDDLILSTKSSERHWELLDEAKQVLLANGLTPHPRKCRWYSSGADRFIVTGVNIAGKVSAPREIKRLTRSRLHDLAVEGKEIDSVTRGYLAHIKDIDRPYYLHMMAFYKRKKYEYVTAK